MGERWGEHTFGYYDIICEYNISLELSSHYETFGTFHLIIANYKRLCLHPRVYQDKSVAVYKTMARTVAILPVSIHKAFFM